MNTVAHYLERWLDISAGFVAAHVERSRHRGIVISRDGLVNLEAFPHRPLHSLHQLRDRTPERLKPLVTKVELGSLLALHQADLIHVHFGYPAADVLSAARRRPFVLSLHGHDITGRLRDEPGRYAAVVRAVDAVIVPSRFLADVTAAAGFPAERLRIIPSGVDTGFFDPTPAPAGPPVVGFVGRLVEKKGIDVLLAAWPRVLDAVPSARLTVLGDGPLRTLLTEVDDSVTWTRPDPTRRRDQVRDAIRASTVVATPSRTAADGDSESLLLVNLEAAASARPVVSTTHGGIPEYVEAGRTGLLVPEADPAALADALVRVLTDRDLAGRLATSGRDLVMQWDVRAMTSRVDSVYEDLLAGAP